MTLGSAYRLLRQEVLLEMIEAPSANASILLTKHFLLHLLKNELYSQQRIRYSWGTVYF